MAHQQKYTTHKLIGILCLAIGGLFGWYHFRPLPPAASPHIPHEVVISSIPAHYTLAGSKLSLSSLEDEKPYLTRKSILIIATISIAFILIMCFQNPYTDYGFQTANTFFSSSDHHNTQSGNNVPPSSTLAQSNDWPQMHYDEDVLWIIYFMIVGQDIGDSPMKVDQAAITMFEQLSNHPALPTDTSNIPDEYTNIPYQLINALERITINIEYMHTYYKAFLPVLFSKEQGCKNLLLFDKIAKTFPNVTEIVCTSTDYTGKKGKYSSRIVNEKFIKGLEKQLKELPNDKFKLKQIIIKTYDHKIKPKLASNRSSQQTWTLSKGDHTLVASTTPYLHAIAKILAMIKNKMIDTQKHPYEATALDAAIFNQLISPTVAYMQAIPPAAKKKWKKIIAKQKSITISMAHMHRYYKAFIPVLFSKEKGCKNLFRFDKIAKTFPNVTQIKCTEINYTIGGKSDIVNKKFIKALKKQLQYISNDKPKLKQIIIKTYPRKIKRTLVVDQVDQQGWSLGKGDYTLMATKTPYLHCIGIVSAMINNKLPPYEATSLDLLMLKKLRNREHDVPDNAMQKWNNLQEQQHNITIDITDMYKYYTLFKKLLFSEDHKHKNLLRLDQIVQLFPHTEEITCQATDYDKQNDYFDQVYSDWDTNYSEDIVSSDFILGLKNRLRKITQDKQHKLKKIVLQTHKNNINCHLYAAQFGNFGWHIENIKNRTILLMSADHYLKHNFIPKMLAMIHPQRPAYNLSPLDMSIFNTLTPHTIALPASNNPIDLDISKISSNAKNEWLTFRQQKTHITIDIEHMYKYYMTFIPLLFSSDPKCKNLLRLDKIVEIFPNATKIICKETDRVSKEWAYSPDIIGKNFIKGLKQELHKVEKHKNLKIVIIKTYRHKIADKLTFGSSDDLAGWCIGQGIHSIVAIKAPCPHAITTISAMIDDQLPPHEVTSLDVQTFKSLIAASTNAAAGIQNQDPKQIAPDVLKKWDQLRAHQTSITINMRSMATDYLLFSPLLVSSSTKNLLLFDQIAKIFPKVTQITCTNTDYDGETQNHSSEIVNSAFIAQVKVILKAIDKQKKESKLQKIFINTYKRPISNNHSLGAHNHDVPGWYIGKAHKTIVLTKTPYSDLLDTLKTMLQGKVPSYPASSLDRSMVTTLATLPADDMPVSPHMQHIAADKKDHWRTFTDRQERITLDIEHMYKHYAALMPLLFDQKITNLLLFDRIVTIFPNVTEIICNDTHYNGNYSSSIINTTFIERLQASLTSIKAPKLKRIIIRTGLGHIKDNVDLYDKAFKGLGWKISKENKTYTWSKEGTLILTK